MSVQLDLRSLKATPATYELASHQPHLSGPPTTLFQAFAAHTLSTHTHTLSTRNRSPHLAVSIMHMFSSRVCFSTHAGGGECGTMSIKNKKNTKLNGYFSPCSFYHKHLHRFLLKQSSISHLDVLLVITDNPSTILRSLR